MGSVGEGLNRFAPLMMQCELSRASPIVGINGNPYLMETPLLALVVGVNQGQKLKQRRNTEQRHWVWEVLKRKVNVLEMKCSRSLAEVSRTDRV